LYGAFINAYSWPWHLQSRTFPAQLSFQLSERPNTILYFLFLQYYLILPHILKSKKKVTGKEKERKKEGGKRTA